jgi:hypothetical protein
MKWGKMNFGTLIGISGINVAEAKNYGIWTQACGENYLFGNKLVRSHSLIHSEYFLKGTYE